MQNTQPWDQDYEPSLYQAYKQAKDNGYVFDVIESINNNEWIDIARYPPIVRLRDYQKYKNMSFEELLNEYPIINDLIVDNITWDMLFWYATRKYIPGYDLDGLVKRWEIYNNLSDVGKDLIDKLYPDNNYVKTHKTDPLEFYIISYDKYMDDNDTIVGLINDLGYEIPDDIEPRDYFYYLLVDLIKLN